MASNFEITNEIRTKLIPELEALQRELPQAKAVASLATAHYVHSRIVQDYRERARGAVGSFTGIQWPPLKASTIAARRQGRRAANGVEIGISSGVQVGSIQVQSADSNGFVVGTRLARAKFFDAKRPIVPDDLPQKSVDDVERFSGSQIEHQLQREI